MLDILQRKLVWKPTKTVINFVLVETGKKKYIHCSNWDRYFCKIFVCSKEELQNSLNEFYKLRCNVAHNNMLNQEDFNKVEKINKNLKEWFETSIDGLDKQLLESNQKVMFLKYGVLCEEDDVKINFEVVKNDT